MKFFITIILVPLKTNGFILLWILFHSFLAPSSVKTLRLYQTFKSELFFTPNNILVTDNQMLSFCSCLSSFNLQKRLYLNFLLFEVQKNIQNNLRFSSQVVLIHLILIESLKLGYKQQAFYFQCNKRRLRIFYKKLVLLQQVLII